MTDLATRIEQAEGPSRELDREIAEALQDAIEATTGKCPPLNMRPYTTSLDAAMTLVPEGWSVGMGDLRGYTPLRWRAHLRDHNPASLTAEGHSHIWKEGHSEHGLALALCAAALRARLNATQEKL